MSISRLLTTIFIVKLLALSILFITTDLYIQVPVYFKVLIGAVILAASYAVILRKTKMILKHIGNLGSDTSRISTVVSELALEAQYLLDSASSQSRSIQSSASSVEESSAMAAQTANEASESSALVSEIDKAAKDGSMIMQDLDSSIESINQVRIEIEKIQDIFEAVTEKTVIIDEIVFNTRLLSFNASIEAERAGSMGAGFAVVAQEIGKLASRSGEAAGEIRNILKESKSQVTSVVQETREKVATGMEVTSKATANFQNIASSITEVATRIDNISAATREQNIGIKQISDSLSVMERAAQENVKVAQSTDRCTLETEEGIRDLYLSINNMAVDISEKNGTKNLSSISSSKEFMPWNDSYSVGLKTIDDQHKVLIDLINKLYRAIRAGSEKSSLRPIFDELISYTDKHFSFEESWFAKTNYHDMQAHMQHHRKLVQTVIKIKDDFLSGDSVSARDIMDFLKNWLVTHIAKEDVKYVDTLKRAGMN